MTDEDETPLDAMLGRMNDAEREAEREAQRAEKAREDALRTFTRALFNPKEN